MVLERVLACAQIGPHQVTYEAVAPLIYIKRARVVVVLGKISTYASYVYPSRTEKALVVTVSTN